MSATHAPAHAKQGRFRRLRLARRTAPAAEERAPRQYPGSTRLDMTDTAAVLTGEAPERQASGPSAETAAGSGRAMARGDHPYPPFTGASGAGLPDSTGEIAAIREAVQPAPQSPLGILQRTRDGLKRLDDPAPVAFLHRALPDGTLGSYWALTGEPAFLGIVKSGEGQVARTRLGYLPDGHPWIVAGNVPALDAQIAMLMVARDRLVYGGRLAGAAPVAAAMPEPEPAPEISPGPDAAADGPALICQATMTLARAQAVPLPEDEQAADAIAGAQANLVHSLDLHRVVEDGQLPPDWVSPDLAVSDKAGALRHLEADVQRHMDTLAAVTAQYRGDETADLAAGDTGGEQ